MILLVLDGFEGFRFAERLKAEFNLTESDRFSEREVLA